ncbi:hypothetical protein PWT90_08667 [Aphanocladium album]|nr:hypothetical protein PWT90_08667 [Aphanocladium album]
MLAKIFTLLALCLCSGACVAAGSSPIVVDPLQGVTYHGLYRNGVEAFLNIPYGQETSGSYRFKPPRPYMAPNGTTIDATAYGSACPQQLGQSSIFPVSLSNITDISEDCLNLNVVRTHGAREGDGLPVMVYIHGGSFWGGENHDLTMLPDAMVRESLANGLPIVHVAINYRLGVFGFAQSESLKSEQSENAGLRDQRLALEWVRDNIANFGGDPNKVTIFGQSSGGLSVGMHIMAYGGRKPAPFQQAICESQALEPGITGNFTQNAMQAIFNYTGCNSTAQQSGAINIECLQKLDMETLLNASIQTYAGDIAHNIGDIWLPAVDGDFLPAAPSELIRKHQFSNVTTMIGWCQDDVSFFTDAMIKTTNDTARFVRSYLPDMDLDNLEKLLSLYPTTDFHQNEAGDLSSEFFRAARVFRDILMVCQPIWYAEALADAGNPVYLYNWNQTILDPILQAVTNHSGFGVVHTSEFAYIFGDLSHYDVSGIPFHPGPADYALARRAARTWTTFASKGTPGLPGHDTFHDFGLAFPGNNQTRIFVAGGPHEGLSAIDGQHSHPEMQRQRLRERCDFINSPQIIERLRY